MRKLLISILFLIILPLHAEVLKGVYVSNDQGAEYADTLVLCEKRETVILSGDKEYSDFVRSYLEMDNLNRYGELYIEIQVKEYAQIDKKRYPNSHYDARAKFIKLLSKKHEQVSIDKCS